MSPRRRPEPEAPAAHASYPRSAEAIRRDQVLAVARTLATLTDVRSDSDETSALRRDVAFELLTLCGTDPGEPCSDRDPTPINARCDVYVEIRALCAASHALGVPSDNNYLALRELVRKGRTDNA